VICDTPDEVLLKGKATGLCQGQPVMDAEVEKTIHVVDLKSPKIEVKIACEDDNKLRVLIEVSNSSQLDCGTLRYGFGLSLGGFTSSFEAVLVSPIYQATQNIDFGLLQTGTDRLTITSHIIEPSLSCPDEVQTFDLSIVPLDFDVGPLSVNGDIVSGTISLSGNEIEEGTLDLSLLSVTLVTIQFNGHGLPHIDFPFSFSKDKLLEELLKALREVTITVTIRDRRCEEQTRRRVFSLERLFPVSCGCDLGSDACHLPTDCLVGGQCGFPGPSVPCDLSRPPEGHYDLFQQLQFMIGTGRGFRLP
jgi:hypothetical protein